MHGLTVSDYVGIRYAWASQDPRIGLDCFGLACYVRATQSDGLECLKSFAWVYERYNQTTEPSNLVRDLLNENCGSAVTRAPGHLDLLALRTGRGGRVGLATIIEESGQLYSVHVGMSSANAQPLARMAPYLLGVWDSSPLVVPYSANPMPLGRY